jgi:hypothetical protein
VLRILILLACALAIAACGGGDDEPAETPSLTPTATAAPTVTDPPTVTASPTLQVTPTPTVRLPQVEPLGFPVDPATRLGVVSGEIGARTLVFDGTGPTALDYARDQQPSEDAAAANSSGWNCRVHFEYEGIAALDFYLPVGTPILSTIDGTATLYTVAVANDFDRYGVDREPYIGNPDRANAPLSPFPGPSSGLGVYVEVRNESFVTEYAHLELSQTDEIVPAAAWVDGYSPASDWAALFAEVPVPRVATALASWPVLAGEQVGASGDAGYSEGPHLHYTLRRTGGAFLCPTNEPGFADGGWLLR